MPAAAPQRFRPAVMVALLVVILGTSAAAQQTAAEPAERAREIVQRLSEAERGDLASLLARVGTAAEPMPEGVPFVARFAGDLDGLQVGAPVLTRGVRVGTVRRITVAFATDPLTVAADVEVLLDLVPDRLVVDGVRPGSPQALVATVGRLVARGLRARLAGGSFPFGETAVELVVDPTAPEATLRPNQNIAELPTAAPEPDRLREELDRLLERLSTLSIERIGSEVETVAVALREIVTGPELRQTMASVAEAAATLRDLGPRLEPQAATALASLAEAAGAARLAAERAGRTVGSLDGTIGPKAPLWTDLQALLREVDGAVRGLRLLLEYLERHPDALLRGRTAGAP